MAGTGGFLVEAHSALPGTPWQQYSSARTSCMDRIGRAAPTWPDPRGGDQDADHGDDGGDPGGAGLDHRGDDGDADHARAERWLTSSPLGLRIFFT
jgi:hypothetical protein